MTDNNEPGDQTKSLSKSIILLMKCLIPSTIEGKNNIPLAYLANKAVDVLGSSSVGIILSNRQYALGYYTWREATIIATCFSTVSVPFSLVVAEILGLDHIFLTYYASAVVIIIILALAQRDLSNLWFNIVPPGLASGGHFPFADHTGLSTGSYGRTYYRLIPIVLCIDLLIC